MKRFILVFLFSIYSYLINGLFLVMELLPPFIRWMVFKLSLKRLGRNTLIDYKTYLRYPSKISIGDNVSINRGCELYASFLVPTGRITLGNNVILSPNVRLFTIGHDPSHFDFPDLAGPIVIGDHAWIGGNSIVLPNISIGEGAVIGAGSVVTRDIPAYAIAVGSPARVIKYRTFDVPQ